MKISEVKAILLGMMVFLLVVGSWFVYHQITRTDYLLPGDILVPKGHDLSGLFFIEQPNKDLESYKIQNESKYMPVLYQDSISGIRPEIQTYLHKRNIYIKSFDQKFRNSVNYNEWGPESTFLKPFEKIKSIREILPIQFQGFNGLLVIAEKERGSQASQIFLLDSNYQVLEGPENAYAYLGRAVVSANFLDRAWVQTFIYGATNGSLFFSTINIIKGKMIIKTRDCGNDYEEDNPFDQFKIIYTSTNPTLSLYKKRPTEWFSNPVFILYFYCSIFFYLFRPFLSVILPFLLIFLLILYRKQIASYRRNLRKKQDNM